MCNREQYSVDCITAHCAVTFNIFLEVVLLILTTSRPPSGVAIVLGRRHMRVPSLAAILGPGTWRNPDLGKEPRLFTHLSRDTYVYILCVWRTIFLNFICLCICVLKGFVKLCVFSP